MADRKYTIDIGTTGAQKAKAEVSGFDQALSHMGSSAKSAALGLVGVGGLAMGLQKVGQMALEAAKVDRVATAFDSLTQKARFSGNTMDMLRKSTQGVVSDFELMRQTNNALMLGVATSSGQMAELALIGRRLGQAMGLDATQGLESLVIGIGRQSKLFLDNLGIIIDVERAYKEYAVSIGKTADKLTDYEKKQAFANETMKKARDLMAGLGDDKSATAIERLGAEWDNFTKKLGAGAIPAANVMLGTLNDMTDDTVKLTTAMGDMSPIVIATFAGPLVWMKNFRREQKALADENEGFVDRMLANIRLSQVARDAQSAANVPEVDKEAVIAALEKEREARNALTDSLAMEINMKDGAWESTKALMESSGEWQDEAIAGLEDYTSGLFSTSEALATLGDSEDRVAQIQARRAAQKHRLTVQGVGDLATLNQAMKGNAEVTKRIMQTQALIESSKAFTGTLATASAIFPPPIPQILAGAALAAGLAQVAVIESQSFARGGVIEGAGGPMQDNVRINASAGESILNAQATARLGRDGVDSLNSGGGVGVTLVVQGNIIGEESWVRDNLLPQITATLRRRLA